MNLNVNDYPEYRVPKDKFLDISYNTFKNDVLNINSEIAARRMDAYSNIFNIC